MPPQPPPPDNTPFWQKIEAMQWWAKFPALTLMVFLRPDLGYRQVGLLPLGGIAIFMILILGVCDPRNHPDDLFLFVIALVTVGLFQRYNRWQLIRQGGQHHTYYIGTSVFERLRLPQYFRNQRRVERFLEPMVCLVAGMLLMDFTPILGRWIVFSAFCLSAFEDVVYRKDLNRMLDTVDGLVVSEVQGDIVEQFSPPTDRQNTKSPSIPTGVGEDLEERIKNRKAKP